MKSFQEFNEQVKEKRKDGYSEFSGLEAELLKLQKQNSKPNKHPTQEMPPKNKTSIEEQLHEVLSKDAEAGDWISDFVKSDNPKFAGKSKKERIKMALGAYYAKQRNEEVELDEAEDWQLKRIHAEYKGLKSSPTDAVLRTHKSLSRVRANYTAGEMGGKEGLISDIMHHRHGEKRMAAYHALSKKDKESLSEKVELDEATPYYNKPSFLKKMGQMAKQERLAREKKEAEKQAGKPEQVKEASKEGLKDACWKGYEAIGTKKKNGKEVPNCVPVKESEELDESSVTTGEYFKKHFDKAMAAKEAGDTEKFKKHYQAAKTGRYGMSSAALTKHKDALDKFKSLKEESLNEVSKDTLTSYVHKSFAAGNELHKQIDKETDPDKKAALRAKLSQRNTGVIKAVKKMNEQAPVAPVPGDKWKSHAVMYHPQTKARVVVKRENKKNYEEDGYKEIAPGQKIKEENGMKSFKELLSSINEELKGNQHKLDKNKNGKLDAQDFKLLRKEEEEIEEGKIDDLKDRMQAKKDADWWGKSNDKPKSNVTKVKGHSYGAGEDGDEDEDEKKQSSEPAVKRGRGRPAGSKSGARV